MIAAILSSRCLGANSDASELIEFSLEDLMSMEIEVTTSAKREQSVFDSASAVYVVTGEDILRTGATTIPDVLRMVPGVFVGQINNNEWAISVRGLGGRFSRYLQVLVDGRSVFDTFFNTINWDEMNLTMSDIDRIEVIRGPGSSVWGSNAVNGVINIVTKKPSVADGTQVHVGAGSFTQAMVSAQTSHSLGEHTNIRVSGNYQKRDGLESVNTEETEGDASGERLSLALSHRLDSNELLVNLDLYRMENDAIYLNTTPYGVASSNGEAFLPANDDKEGYALQVRYAHHIDDKQAIRVRTSIDDIKRESDVFVWDTSNIDLDIEYVASHGINYLTLGSNTRFSSNEVNEGVGTTFTIDPEKDDSTVSSLFLHNTTTVSESWKVDVGVRYEDHSEAGENVQGTLRAIWSPDKSQRFWLAASKADGTPSRLTTASSRAAFAVIPGTPATFNIPTLVNVVSDGSNFENTKLMAYEMGYRLALSEVVSVDTTVFYNEYENLFSVDSTSIPTFILPTTEPISGLPYVSLDVPLAGEQDSRSSGVEIAINWRLQASWYLQYSGSYINFKDEKLFAGSLGAALPAYSMGVDSPKQQHSMRLTGDLSDQWSLGLWLRYVDQLEQVQIDDYTVLDARISYQPIKDLTFGLTLKNIGGASYVEAVREAFYFDTFEVEQSIFADVRWKF